MRGLRNPRIAPVQYYVKTLVAFTLINKLTNLECSKESGFFFEVASVTKLSGSVPEAAPFHPAE